MQEIIEPQIQVFLEKGKYQHPDVRIQGTVIGVKTLIDLLLDDLLVSSKAAGSSTPLI